MISASGEQEKFVLKGEVNGEKALEQLFRHLYPGDTQHVDLLSTALTRFTPATLLCMNRKGVGKFLQEMTNELTVLGYKCSAEADLSAAHALPDGKKFLQPPCRCLMTLVCWTSAEMKRQFVQPQKPSGDDS